jgi:TRAP transporter TAXI family solute receptor
VNQASHRLLSLLVAIAAALLVVPAVAQIVPPETQRISFQIATGPVSGSYLRVGETIARIISNPPGLARCEVDGVCGPEGLIATSRSSSGSIANAISVNSGRVKSAIVQGDIAAAAVAGRGPFAKLGPLANLRAIARLHEETLHLVVAPRSRIKRLRDLIGKRVAIDSDKAATNYTVRGLLSTAGISTRRVRISFQSADQAARDLRDGKIDAFFVIGVAPIAVVDGLVRRGQARVVGIDSSVVTAAAHKSATLSRHVLPADTYRSSKAAVTLNIASLWLVGEELSEDVVHAILRSLWHPANRPELNRLGRASRTIDVKKAAVNLPVPLHKGAQSFYAEAAR